MSTETIDEGHVTRCRSCGAPIVWMTTKSGKAMPLDTKKRLVFTETGEQVTGRESHFATCPNAAAHRSVK